MFMKIILPQAHAFTAVPLYLPSTSTTANSGFGVASYANQGQIQNQLFPTLVIPATQNQQPQQPQLVAVVPGRKTRNVHFHLPTNEHSGGNIVGAPHFICAPHQLNGQVQTNGNIANNFQHVFRNLS